VRLGSHRPIPVDVRLIAATNVKLDEAVAAGRFRADLFYRLAVARLTIDPLRARPRDILPLARHFIEGYARASARGDREPGPLPTPTLTPAAEQALLDHPWVGNIRELENAVHYAVLLCHDGRITPEDLPLIHLPPPQTASAPAAPPAARAPSPPPLDPRSALRESLRTLYQQGTPQLWDQIEETVIRTAYEHAACNQLRTARLLGLSRSVVRARLLEFGVLARSERDTDPETPAPGLPAGAGEEPPGGKSHILVIEDDGVVRQSLGELLAEEGYEVSFAENGQAALQLLHTVRLPDLIVLDLMMPVMDGWQFRAIQKNHPRLGVIPVVAISADRSAAANAISAEAYLRKPLDVHEFLRVVERTQLSRSTTMTAAPAAGRAG
jgi:DNA-binding NtrC family response regulator